MKITVKIKPLTSDPVASVSAIYTPRVRELMEELARETGYTVIVKAGGQRLDWHP